MRLLLIAAALLWSGPLAAADLAGAWKLTAEGRTALVLSLKPDGTRRWSATIVRPTGLEIYDGAIILNANGPPSEQRVTGERIAPDKAELTLESAKPGAGQVRYVISALDDSHAEVVMSMGGQSSRAMPLTRATADAAPASDWEDRGYPIDQRWPDNREVEAMFDADQGARASPSIDWAKLNPEDAKRRARTAQLVAEGKLRSANDFYAAAFIFQHGDQPSDFLLAHTFAMISAARGRTDATWIAAATLDRYLQKIGQPQVYGTQYFTRPNEPVTQEPYNRSLVSDALRATLGVPPLAAQEARRLAMQAAREQAAKKP